MSSLSVLFIVFSVVAVTSVFLLALPLHRKVSDDITPVKRSSDFLRHVNIDSAAFQELTTISNTSENATDSFRTAVHSGNILCVF
jgi:hypothetical protein